MKDQYDNAECTLEVCILYNVVKHECDNHDAVNRSEIHLKSYCRTIPVSRFVIEHTIECTPVCNVVLRVAKAMVTELDSPCCYKRHVTICIFVVLQMIPFLGSKLVMWLNDPIN